MKIGTIIKYKDDKYNHTLKIVGTSDNIPRFSESVWDYLTEEEMMTIVEQHTNKTVHILSSRSLIEPSQYLNGSNHWELREFNLNHLQQLLKDDLKLQVKYRKYIIVNPCN